MFSNFKKALFIDYYFEIVCEYIKDFFIDYIYFFSSCQKAGIIIKTDVLSLTKLCNILKKHAHFQYKFLVDMCIIDYNLDEMHSWRFVVNYIILSVKKSSRLTILLKILDGESLHTTTKLFFNAGWIEREIWEMFGIYFYYNLNLRRLLTDYGFLEKPLKKDFPLTGYSELFYNEVEKKLRFLKLKEAQKFNCLSFVVWWELQ